MQEATFPAGLPTEQSPASSRHTWRSIMAFALPLLIVALIGGELYWLQWSAQRGLTLGYPLPQVSVTNATTRLQLNRPTSFTATATGRDLVYSWDFGDQSSAASVNNVITHTYSNNGSYTVNVTVSDPLGHQASTSFSVQVFPPPPVASFTASPYTFFTQYVTFDASASIADASTSITSYNWDFGDGTTDSSTYSQYYHQYANSGTYTITLIVVDGTGQQSQPATVTISV